MANELNRMLVVFMTVESALVAKLALETKRDSWPGAKFTSIDHFKNNIQKC